MPRHITLAAIIAIVAIVAGILAARVLLDRGSASLVLAGGTLLDPPRPLPPFKLVDEKGAPFDGQRLRDRWSVLFFGFTSCPDVCPTTLGMLAQTEKLLADLPAGRRPQIVLVSVDPQRDTPEKLAAYVHFFSPTFTAVTGTQDAIDSFTRQLGVPVAIHPLDNGQYTVDHSAALFLIDRNGALRALFSTPHSPATIADDYRRITTSND